MRNTNRTLQMHWWLAPIFVGMLALGGCSLLGGGSSGGISPADATVTAIVTQAMGQANCQPQITPMLDTQNHQAILGKSTITFIGACWLAGRTVTLGILDHSMDSKGTTEPAIKPLVDVNGTPETATIKPDGTFIVQMQLTGTLQQYVWDTRLPFVAQVDGFVEFAATSVQVTSS
jgi:hypothetical protein